MSLKVEFVVQPKVLLLAWQAPDHLRDRRRWLVARIDVSRAEWVLTYPTPSEFEAANPGASLADLRRLGFEGYPSFLIKERVHASRVRQSILRRLPPRSRPDFELFVGQFGLTHGPDLTDEVLVAYTGAKVPSDGFSVAAELSPELQRGDLVLEVAGTRHHMPEGCRLAVGDRLSLQPEPDNQFDGSAIAIFGDGCKIGYVNRLHAQVIGHWISSRRVDVCVQRMNGRLTEPRVFALVRVRPLRENVAA